MNTMQIEDSKLTSSPAIIRLFPNKSEIRVAIAELIQTHFSLLDANNSGETVSGVCFGNASAERYTTPLLSVAVCVKAVQKSFHSRLPAPHSLKALPRA